MSDAEDKKRKRSSNSSVSDLDNSSSTSTPLSRKEKKKSRKEKESEEANMEAIKNELKGINERLSKMLTKEDPHLEKLIQTTFTNMKDVFLKSVSHRIDVLEKKIFEKECENDKLRQSLTSLQETIMDKDEENSRLKRHLEKIEMKTQEKLNEHEQYSRRNNVRIDGVEETETETSEMTINKVVEVIGTHMKDIKLNRSDIDIAHRIGKKKDGKRQIIVKFVSRVNTEKVLKSRKVLKGTNIFINEDLTRANQQALACVRKKLPDEIESAWARDGRIKYKNKVGNIHTLRYEEYNTWFELPWPAQRK